LCTGVDDEWPKAKPDRFPRAARGATIIPGDDIASPTWRIS
jgi:hypothetical protein